MLHLVFAALLTPSQVLAKARAAEGAMQPGTYRVEVRETLNDGTISYVRTSQGDNYVSTEQEGSITRADGRLDGVNWNQNANGAVLTGRGPSVVDDPYSDAVNTPEASSSGLSVEDESNGNVVLVIAPRSGLVERRTYDSKTFLLSRIDYDDPQGRRSFVYSGYRSCFGEMVAARIQYTSETANDDAVFDLISCDRIQPGSVSFAIPPNKPVFDLGSRTSLQIPADFTLTGIVVRVTVAGRGLDFLLDSGSSESVLDAGVAHELGLNVRNRRTMSFMGTTTVAQTVIDDLALGDLHARNFAIEVVPFSRLIDGGYGANTKVVGLLGGDFFASGRIAVDFSAKTVTMMAPTAPLATEGWTKLPIQVTSFVPLTVATFSGHKGTFVVDLGAWSTILYQHYFTNFTRDGLAPVQGEAYGIANKGQTYRSYNMSRLDIGDLAYADVLVQVLDAGRSNDQVGYDGLLGRTFWENFALIFDYAGQTLYIKPEI